MHRYLEAEIGLECPIFESGLDGAQEACGVGTIDQAVVVRQCEVDHLSNRDDVAASVILDNDGTLDHGAGSEDGHLRLVDDGCIEECAAAAGVGESERTARQFVGTEFVATCAFGDVGDRLGDSGKVEAACIANNRNEKSALAVDGNAEVFRLVVGDGARIVDDLARVLSS